MFKLAAISADAEERPRYEPYGVAVTKDWLFSKGGRPVIYQSETEYSLLPDELKYRHVRYEPNAGIDHTWEREWRIQADSLELSYEDTLVVVPTSAEAFELMYSHSDWEVEVDRSGEPFNAYPEPRWMVVSLDFFGV